MTEAKHTPGPWRFSKYAMTDSDVAQAIALGLTPVRHLTNDGQATVMAGTFGDEDSKPIARVECQTKFKRGQGYRTECEERDANARLIAAAPDMLDALKGVITVRDKASFDAARAAIAKATGHD